MMFYLLVISSNLGVMDYVKIVLSDNAAAPSRQLIKYVPRHIFAVPVEDVHLDLQGILPHEDTFTEYFDRRVEMTGDLSDRLPTYPGTLGVCMRTLAEALQDWKMIVPLHRS